MESLLQIQSNLSSSQHEIRNSTSVIIDSKYPESSRRLLPLSPFSSFNQPQEEIRFEQLLKHDTFLSSVDIKESSGGENNPYITNVKLVGKRIPLKSKKNKKGKRVESLKKTSLALEMPIILESLEEVARIKSVNTQLKDEKDSCQKKINSNPKKEGMLCKIIKKKNQGKFSSW